MDRNQSQDWLELYDPDRPDADVGDADVLRHQLAESPELRQRLARRLEIDDKISAVLCDVPVPEHLKAAVLARLADQKAPVAVQRRRWHALAGPALVAACLAVACVVNLLIKQPDWNPEIVSKDVIQFFNEHPFDLGCNAGHIPDGIKQQLLKGCSTVSFQGYQCAALMLHEPRSDKHAMVIVVPVGAARAKRIIQQSGSTYFDSAHQLTLLFRHVDDDLLVIVVVRERDFDVFVDEKPIT